MYWKFVKPCWEQVNTLYLSSLEIKRITVFKLGANIDLKICKITNSMNGRRKENFNFLNPPTYLNKCHNNLLANCSAIIAFSTQKPLL